MSLFDGCKLPDDERALEILRRIDELWENNAGVVNACSLRHPRPSIRHHSVSIQQKEELIKLSTTCPQVLENMLNDEVSLHNILLFVTEEDVD